MFVLKWLIVAGVVSGVIAVLGGADSSSATSTAEYCPDTTLPTLFQPMRH
jgi:hypothetical protein